MRPDRDAFRPYALDGAALLFQPRTGVHVRVATKATRSWRRRAPRVAMFGITNACNLSCDFCSRDTRQASAWTVPTAVAALQGLAAAGTLEVAYGGGEPFTFRGFAELVAELDQTTPLAQHVTTNGTRIDRARLRPFVGRLGQVRVSIYRGVPWHGAAEALAQVGQRWGANVLVDGPALDELEGLLTELHARGAHDVSLLSYVGPDPARHLDAAGERRLAEIIGNSPIPCRLSVCFGERISVPRLYTMDGGRDCGAGRDFVTITSDRRVQACSFHDHGEPGATAEEILRAWSMRAPALGQPSLRRGCARTQVLAEGPGAPREIAVWQAFAGNNSGECFLVARFQDASEAAAYLADLLPGWTPDGPYSAQWRDLFRDEGILGPTAGERFDPDASPRELLAIGRTVVAVQYAAEDAFPELRALAWKRGAAVPPGGVHVHDGATMLLAVRARDRADRDRLTADNVPEHAQTWIHGSLVLATVPLFPPDHGRVDLRALEEMVRAWVEDRRFDIEILFRDVAPEDLLEAKKHLGERPPLHPRLWISFWGPDDETRAARLAEAFGDEARVTQARGTVLVDPAPDRKRLAVLAYRHEAAVRALDGARVRVSATVWFPPTPKAKRGRPERRVIDRDRLEAFAAEGFARTDEVGITWPDPAQTWASPVLYVATEEPAVALRTIEAFVVAEGACVSFGAADLDPVGAALRRVVDSLGA